jgi:WD40 repeat protein
MVTPTAPLCPQPTPEPFWVEPVTSPTDQLSQTIAVHIGNGEAVTITTESGTFTATGDLNPYNNPALVDVTLLPDTTHYLEILARVRTIRHSNGCTYGGYTFSTARDKNGAPLVITQGQPAPPRVSTAAITPDNASQLERLVIISLDASLTDLVFSSDSEMIGVGYLDRISRWSVTTGQEAGRIGDGHEEASALSVATNSDQSLVATGGGAWDNSVRVWDTVTGDVRLLGRHESIVHSVAFNPSGTRLASGSNDDKVWIWDLASEQPVVTLEGDVPKRHQRFANLYWLDDDTLVAAGSDVIYWWDVTTGQLLERLARPEEAAFFVAVALGRDGRRLAAVAQDDTIYFWNRDTAQWTTWSARPGCRLAKVAFSPDEQLLATATYEGEWSLWNVTTQELLVSHSVPADGEVLIRFSPDGRTIAVAGLAIELWGIPP